jgi:micrococcal nuclease
MWKRLLCLLCCFNETKTEEVIDEIPDGLIPKDLPLFVPPLKTGKVIKVYDGDTITIASKVPGLINSPIYKFSVRLNGIDTPEMKTHNNDEKEIAIKARDALSEKIMGKVIRLENVQTEKYGRLLCEIYIGDTHLNKWLIDQRYAMEYDGGTKIIPDSWKKYHEQGTI